MKKTMIVIALVVAVILPGARGVSALQYKPSPTLTYHVKPGDTLWKIAALNLSGQDRRKAIYSIQQLNHLDTSALTPGQKILLPLR